MTDQVRDRDTPHPGQVAHIVDEVGGTFAFPEGSDAQAFARDEESRGAEGVTTFTVAVPRAGMSWDEVADYACEQGPIPGGKP